MDVVYVVKAQARSGSTTDELRYSLRSLRHLPHDRVIVAGWKPEWCHGVEYVPTVQRKTKFENALTNLRAALEVVSERFVLMNDDFFILQPVTEPLFHGGSWSRTTTAHGPYQAAKVEVWKILRAEGIDDPVTYELHVPMIFDRDRLAETLERFAGRRIAGYQRSLYGNLWGVGGEQMTDPKVATNRFEVNGHRFLSTNDRTFRNARVGHIIRSRFPDPSPYE